MNNIVLVNPARCGSSWLTTAFEQTLNYNNFNAATANDIKENWVRFNGKSVNVYKWSLEEKIELINNSTPYIVKVFTDNMVDLTLFKNADYVWLYRKDIVEHYLSFYYAIKSGVFNIGQYDNYNQPIFEEDKKFTKFYVKRYNEAKKVYNTYCHLFKYKVAYEDLFTNNPWNFTPTEVNSCIKLNTYSQEVKEQVKEILKNEQINHIWL